MSDLLKSNNFCLLPFILMNSRGFGRVKICSQISGFMGVPKNEYFTTLDDFRKKSYSVEECYNLNEHSIEEIWNSQFMRSFRMAKINNVELACCRVCRKDETVEGGRDSKRQSVINKLGSQFMDRVVAAKQKEGFMDVAPAWWDLRLSNRCNMACRMCIPQSSSKLLVEFKRHREELSSLNRKNLLITEEEIGRGGFLADSKKFLDDFSANAKSVETIELHGGEPTIEPGFWELLSRLIVEDRASSINIVIHTNILQLKASHIDMLSKFKGGKFIASIDSVGKENEYLRYPSQWENVAENIPLFAALGEKWVKNIHQTISAYQCCSVHKFLEFFEALVIQRELRIGWSFAFVTNPSWLDISNIPVKLKQQEACRLREFYAKSPLTTEAYFDSSRFCRELNRLIEALESESVRDEMAFKQFIAETEYFDRTRNENVLEVFPHYKDLFC